MQPYLRCTYLLPIPIRFQTKTCNRIYKIEFNPLVKRARIYKTLNIMYSSVDFGYKPTCQTSSCAKWVHIPT